MTFGTTEYYYNSRNRLERVTLPDGRIATYTYDPFGRRIQKDVAGQVTYFAYSDEGLIGEYDQSGNLTKAYGWKPKSTWGTNPVFMVEGGNYYFYQNDHLGTPQKLTDINGNTVWSATYTSFGNAEIEVATVTNNLRFSGQYQDEETGLHYNWNRYYDPNTGRYTQEDPIGFEGGDINPYLYVRNIPVRLKDPLGLFSVKEAIRHYFKGNGAPVTVAFNEVDIGLMPKDFSDFNELVESMYKKEGELIVDINQGGNAGGWAGGLVYRLKGKIISSECCWRFVGYVGAFDNPFDFDSKEWGSREYWAEFATREIGFYGPLLGGVNYEINFSGHREVTDGGNWSK